MASGGGAELAGLARLLGAPLMTSLLANGLFAGDPRYAGVLGGLGDGRALRLMEQVDVLLVAGAGLNQWTTHFGSALEGTGVIRIDADPGVLAAAAGPGEVALLGDVRTRAQALAGPVHGRWPTRWRT